MTTEQHQRPPPGRGVTAGRRHAAPVAVPQLSVVRVPASKSVVPELPADFTARLRLRRRLDEATADQVVVVSAPAGSGKTLLLADWVRDGGGPETVWVSLDADDNDPRRLWSAVVTALSARPSAARDGRLQVVAGAAALPGGVDVVEELADTLDAPDTPVRIVLDDVQELTGREVLRDIARLVRRRPAGMRLVLASRADPPISIPRLRLEGRLRELRADALRSPRTRPPRCWRPWASRCRGPRWRRSTPARRAGLPDCGWPRSPCGAPMTQMRSSPASRGTSARSPST